jgi:hypothetical protein
MVRTPVVRSLLRTALLVTLCLFVGGCQKSKLTKANYDKIKDGMTLAEVEAILGKGEKEDPNLSPADIASGFGVDVKAGLGGLESHGNKKAPGQSYRWTKGDKTIWVVFVDDKMRTKRQEGVE